MLQQGGGADARVCVAQRVEAAAPRVQALNPRVQIDTSTDPEQLKDEAFLSAFDLIVLTDVDALTLVSAHAGGSRPSQTRSLG